MLLSPVRLSHMLGPCPLGGRGANGEPADRGCRAGPASGGGVGVLPETVVPSVDAVLGRSLRAKRLASERVKRDRDGVPRGSLAP